MKRIFWLSCFTSFAGLIACTDCPCHPIKHPELIQQTTANDQPIAPGGQTMGNVASASDRILVFKADGSLQCSGTPGTSAEEMEKELAGIKVYARQNRSDGKMRTQVCGSSTGKINVFEIDLSSLARAEEKGFKKFIAGK